MRCLCRLYWNVAENTTLTVFSRQQDRGGGDARFVQGAQTGKVSNEKVKELCYGPWEMSMRLHHGLGNLIPLAYCLCVLITIALVDCCAITVLYHHDLPSL